MQPEGYDPIDGSSLLQYLRVGHCLMTKQIIESSKPFFLQSYARVAKERKYGEGLGSTTIKREAKKGESDRTACPSGVEKRYRSHVLFVRSVFTNASSGVSSISPI